MPQHDEVAVAAAATGEDHDTVTGGFDLGACRGSIVDPLVRPPLLKDGMATQAEPRSDARVLERRAQKDLSKILAFRSVVSASSRNVLEPDSAKRLPPPRELGREYLSGAYHASVEMEGLEDGREAIAAAKVPVKIDVAAKYVRELHRDSVRNSRRIGRSEERSLDLARFHLDSARQLDLLLESLKAFADAIEREHRVLFREIPK